MKPKQFLILDYSVDRSESMVIKRWLPADSPVSSLFTDTEESFPDNLINEDFTHVIHSGSLLSITKIAPFTTKAVNFIRQIRDKGIWQMGICYGHQLVCRALIGKHAVRSSPNGFEAGWCNVNFVNDSMKMFSVRENETVWQHHFDEVTELPEGSLLLATNPHSTIQAYVNYNQHLFGTQFHPEFDKETGDAFFLKDRELLEENSYNVDSIITRGPSFDTGKTLFTFFIEQCPV